MQCIGYVAYYELTEDKWPQVIPALLENMMSSYISQATREASVEAIGHIFHLMGNLVRFMGL